MVFVQVHIRATSVSGHGWWTKWSATYESPWEQVISDGKPDDYEGGRDSAERALQDYAAGRFTAPGETLIVQWTNPDETLELRRAFFPAEE